MSPDAPDYTLLSDVNVVGSVTLDVNVVGSVTINTNITGVESGVTFDVAITSSTVTLDVNITNTSLTVNIGAPLSADGHVETAIVESIQIDVNIAASSVTLDVNIASSAVTLDVNIVSSSVTLDVSITNATVTLNVSVTNEVLQSKLAKPALAFNGENAYVEVAHSDTLNITDAITLEAWVRVPSTAVASGRFVLVKDETEYRYGLYKESTQKPAFYLRLATAGTVSVIAPKTVNDGEWHCWTGTFDGRYLKFYLDGNLTATEDVGGTDTITTSTKPLLIAKWGVAYFRGDVALVRIYNRVLPDQDVEHNYNHPQSPVTDGLVLWLNFDEGSGSTAYDKSGNGNHGTIYNCVWVSEQGQVAPLLNVNLTASQITLNINITAQDIDIKIYTPSGRWVTASELLTGSTYVYGTSIAAGDEVELVSLSGRGRIKQIGFYFVRSGTGTDAYNDVHLRVYIDGETSPSVDVRPAEVDRLAGYIAMTQISYGLNRVDYGTDEYVTVAQASSPGGAVTTLRYDTGDSEAVFAGGYIRPEAEFTSSASVKVYNAGSVSASVYVVVIYGEYL